MRSVRDALPPPLLDAMAMMPFPTLQGLFDPLLPPGLQWYWKGDFVKDLPDDALDAHLEQAARTPSALSLAHFYPIDGAVQRVAEDDPTWSWSNATWSLGMGEAG